MQIYKTSKFIITIIIITVIIMIISDMFEIVESKNNYNSYGWHPSHVDNTDNFYLGNQQCLVGNSGGLVLVFVCLSTCVFLSTLNKC